MKKFFKEFKEFISRGNILDMAVGVIIGGAFSAIVTAFTNKIIMPIVNKILQLCTGGNGLEAAFTFLEKAYDPLTGEIDLAKSIYIDWGAFITAILDFLIIAFTLFVILKIAMKSSQMLHATAEKARGKLSKEDKKELKARGLNWRDKATVDAYLAEKQAKADAEKAEAEAKAKAEREANPTTEELLKQIRDLLATKKD